MKLSDANAKAIGRSGSRRKKLGQPEGGITNAMIKKMNKTACVAELALGGVPYTGNTQELSDKLLRYRSFLECIIRGLKCGKLVWNQEKVHISGRSSGQWQYQRDAYGRNQRVWVATLQKVSYSGTTNLAGLKEAGKQLHIKGASKKSKKDLLTKILDQGLRFGFVDEDDYEDLLDGKIIEKISFQQKLRISYGG